MQKNIKLLVYTRKKHHKTKRPHIGRAVWRGKMYSRRERRGEKAAKV